MREKINHELRAGHARSTIEHGPRERSTVAAQLRKPPPVGPDHVSAVVRKQKAVQQKFELEARLAEVTGIIKQQIHEYQSTGKRSPNHGQLLREQGFLKSQLHNVHGTLGSLNQLIKSGPRSIENLFIDTASLMLPPDVFNEIMSIAAKKHREFVDTIRRENGDATAGEPHRGEGM